MQTIGHHTCSNEGGAEFVLNHAPFYSDYLPAQNKKPFLGSGYYFWDYNVKMAHIWGRLHYSNNYFIAEGELEADDSKLFDLVGNRMHIEFLLQLQQKFQQHGKNRQHWYLGQFIEFLKRLNQHEQLKGVFPFTIIKALDNKWTNEQKIIKFAEGKNNYIHLDPRIMICFTNKNHMQFNNKRLINPKE